MSDEEKKAIDILINEIADIVISEYCTHCKICENEDTECYYTKVIDIVYNLVQKQSKEIEELKENTKKCEYYEMVADELYKNSVSKDKIKAKIEEVDIQLQKLKDGLTGRKTNFVNKNMLFAQKKVLQSLLEKE